MSDAFSAEALARFFNRFCDAFRTVDGAKVAELYHAPGIGLGREGNIYCLQTKAEIKTFFQTALDRYYAAGCRDIRYKDLDVTPVTPESALGTVTWELLSGEGDVLMAWRQSYNIFRGEGGLQIFASAFHAGSFKSFSPVSGG